MTIPKIFNDSTKLVIDQLEGGYFNPAWHNVGDPRYSTSGETMFGLDRHAGFDLFYKGKRKASNVRDNLKFINN